MSEPLTEAQSNDAREIAEQEVRRFARLLADEIARAPMRVDARDLWRSFNESIKRYDQGEIA